MPTNQPPRIAILGGGITGLAAAWELKSNHPQIEWQLFEASPRLGGVLETVNQDGWLIEQSADNFLTKIPSVVTLCKELGIQDHLLPTAEDRRRAMVVRKGRVLPVPKGFVLMAPKKIGSIIASSVLSLRGKARLAYEPFVSAKKTKEDESVASFARRRLGQEALDQLVQPLVAGIYTADPEKLSLAATLPQFPRQEAEYGSLWRANRQAKESSESLESGARYGLFMAPEGGMQQLVDALERALPEDRISKQHPISACKRTERGSWLLIGENQQPLGKYDGLICTLPAYHAATVAESFDDELAGILNQIPYASASVVCFGVRNDQIQKPVNGFGFVVPEVENRSIIATSFSSYKFPGRSPKGHTLIRTFVGGALNPELADLDECQIIYKVKNELRELIGLAREPIMAQVVRWPRRMPQYHVGHLDLVARIEQRQAEWKGLQFAGAAYRGVGIPQCVADGRKAASQVAEGIQ